MQYKVLSIVAVIMLVIIATMPQRAPPSSAAAPLPAAAGADAGSAFAPSWTDILGAAATPSG